MRILASVVALIAAPISAVALPASAVTVVARQRQQAPPPCVRMDPAPTQEETEARFNAFVEVFVGKSKNLYKAFEYIAADYINHNPAARNGSQSAWDILSPFWNSYSHTYLRSTMKENMSWVNYRAGAMGEVVDRFRWEGGCIVEHVCRAPPSASQAPIKPSCTVGTMTANVLGSGIKVRGILHPEQHPVGGIGNALMARGRYSGLGCIAASTETGSSGHQTALVYFALRAKDSHSGLI